MEDGNWFLYAAMIVIAFVSWVFNKIQEATAARRRGEEIDQHYEEDEEEQHIFEEREVRREPPPVPTTAEDSMRRLMEALGGTPVKAPQPPPPQVTRTEAQQVPTQGTRAKATPPRMTAEERAALERLKKQKKKGIQLSRVRRRSAGRLNQMSIAELVRDPDGVRKAVVLREILDRPRSERPWE